MTMKAETKTIGAFVKIDAGGQWHATIPKKGNRWIDMPGAALDKLNALVKAVQGRGEGDRDQNEASREAKYLEGRSAGIKEQLESGDIEGAQEGVQAILDNVDISAYSGEGMAWEKDDSGKEVRVDPAAQLGEALQAFVDVDPEEFKEATGMGGDAKEGDTSGPDLSAFEPAEQEAFDALLKDGYTWERIDEDDLQGWMLYDEENDSVAASISDEGDANVEDWVLDGIDNGGAEGGEGAPADSAPVEGGSPDLAAAGAEPAEVEALNALLEDGYRWEAIDEDGMTGWMLTTEEGDSIAASIMDGEDGGLNIEDWVLDGIDSGDDEELALAAPKEEGRASGMELGREDQASLVASGGKTKRKLAAPVKPPAAWFENPNFKMGTPLTVTQEGRVFGHLALWGTCHAAYANASGDCIVVPGSNADYAMFHLGVVETAEGKEVPVGRLAMETTHADDQFSSRRAIAHYENTGLAIADIHCGEDEFGIWFSGALRPDATETQIRSLKASPLSGDWRYYPQTNDLELVMALAVNMPGFAVPRPKFMVASGAVRSLVAAGILAPKRIPREKVEAAKAGDQLAIDDIKYLQKLAARERALEAKVLKQRALVASGVPDKIHALAKSLIKPTSVEEK